MHLNRAPGSLERNGAAVGPGGEDVTEEIRLETGLWRWIQFCNSRSRQGIEAAYQTEGLFGHLHIEVVEVNVWMGKLGPEAERPISENVRRGFDAVLSRLDHGCKVLVLYRGAM